MMSEEIAEEENGTTYSTKLSLATLAMMHGLSIMHNQGLAHGGLRSECVFVSANRAWVTLPAVRADGSYLAPKEQTGSPSPASDMWDLALVMFEMVFGRRARAKDLGHVSGFMRMITSPTFCRLWEGCTRVDPADRMSLEEAFNIFRSANYHLVGDVDRDVVGALDDSFHPGLGLTSKRVIQIDFVDQPSITVMADARACVQCSFVMGQAVFVLGSGFNMYCDCELVNTRQMLVGDLPYPRVLALPDYWGKPLECGRESLFDRLLFAESGDHGASKGKVTMGDLQGAKRVLRDCLSPGAIQKGMTYAEGPARIIQLGRSKIEKCVLTERPLARVKRLMTERFGSDVELEIVRFKGHEPSSLTQKGPCCGMVTAIGVSGAVDQAYSKGSPNVSRMPLALGTIIVGAHPQAAEQFLLTGTPISASSVAIGGVILDNVHRENISPEDLLLEKFYEAPHHVETFVEIRMNARTKDKFRNHEAFFLPEDLSSFGWDEEPAGDALTHVTRRWGCVKVHLGSRVETFLMIANTHEGYETFFLHAELVRLAALKGAMIFVGYQPINKGVPICFRENVICEQFDETRFSSQVYQIPHSYAPEVAPALRLAVVEDSASKSGAASPALGLAAVEESASAFASASPALGVAGKGSFHQSGEDFGSGGNGFDWTGSHKTAATELRAGASFGPADESETAGHPVVANAPRIFKLELFECEEGYSYKIGGPPTKENMPIER
jgi:hypothetical protein